VPSAVVVRVDVEALERGPEGVFMQQQQATIEAGSRWIRKATVHSANVAPAFEVLAVLGDGVVRARSGVRTYTTTQATILGRYQRADGLAVPPRIPRTRYGLRKLRPVPEVPAVVEAAPVAAPAPIVPVPEDLGVPDFVARGRGCVVVADVEHALAYGDKSLVKLIRGAWATEVEEGRDFDVLTFGEAKKMLFGARVPSRGTLNPRGLTVLYETGFDLVLQKTDKPEGQRLRRRLADEVLPKLRRGQTVAPAGAALPPPAPLDVRAIVTETLRELVPAIIRETLAALPRPVAPPSPALPAPEVAEVPKGWIDSDALHHRVSALAGVEVSVDQVNKAIRTLKIRERIPAVARAVMVDKAMEAGVGRVQKWFYAPIVVGDLVGRFAPPTGDLFAGRSS
jgi:hypothetical protein